MKDLLQSQGGYVFRDSPITLKIDEGDIAHFSFGYSQASTASDCVDRDSMRPANDPIDDSYDHRRTLGAVPLCRRPKSDPQAEAYPPRCP